MPANLFQVLLVVLSGVLFAGFGSDVLDDAFQHARRPGQGQEFGVFHAESQALFLVQIAQDFGGLFGAPRDVSGQVQSALQQHLAARRAPVFVAGKPQRLSEHAADDCLGGRLRDVVVAGKVGQGQHQMAALGEGIQLGARVLQLVFLLNRHEQVPGDFFGMPRRHIVGDAAGQVVEGGNPHLDLPAVEVAQIAQTHLPFFFLIRFRRLLGRLHSGQHHRWKALAESGNAKAGNAKTGNAKTASLLNLQRVSTRPAGSQGGGNDAIGAVHPRLEDDARVKSAAAVVILRQADALGIFQAQIGVKGAAHVIDGVNPPGFQGKEKHVAKGAAPNKVAFAFNGQLSVKNLGLSAHGDAGAGCRFLGLLVRLFKVIAFEFGNLGDKLIEPLHVGVFVEQGASHGGGMGQAQRVLQQGGFFFLAPLDGRQGSAGQFLQLPDPLGGGKLGPVGGADQALADGRHLGGVRQLRVGGCLPLGGQYRFHLRRQIGVRLLIEAQELPAHGGIVAFQASFQDRLQLRPGVVPFG